MFTNYCENCGEELTSLFCEVCGSISSNIPNSMSNDDSLAGLLANVINQGKQLSFTQIMTVTKSSERTFRLFAQLEKTNNFLISNQENDFIISCNLYNAIIKNLVTLSKGNYAVRLLSILLEFFPLSQNEISELFNGPIDPKALKKLLGKNYESKSETGKLIFKKKD